MCGGSPLIYKATLFMILGVLNLHVGEKIHRGDLISTLVLPSLNRSLRVRLNAVCF